MSCGVLGCGYGGAGERESYRVLLGRSEGEKVKHEGV